MLTCHCGFEYDDAALDHCPYCYCETYEAECTADYLADMGVYD